MSGHTPGPWAYNRFFGIQENSRGVLGKTICEVQYPPLPSEEHEANGRLIAAAPDLLKACKNAAEVMPGDTRDQKETLDELYGVIAKAEGK